MQPEREIEARRLGEIWARLDEVPDPELDEPITAMGFVELVTLGEGDRVRSLQVQHGMLLQGEESLSNQGRYERRVVRHVNGD